uniref:Membrane protein BRI3 n=1 Tax=Acrobeloides nanus TaxID=290746 RepID=A0A914CQJ5_9BILA
MGKPNENQPSAPPSDDFESNHTSASHPNPPAVETMRLTQTQATASQHGYGTAHEAPPPYQEALSMPPPYMPNTFPKPNTDSNIYPQVPYPAGPTPNAYIAGAPPPLQFPPLPQPPPQTIHTTTIIAPTGNCAYCLNGQVVNETDLCCLLCLILLAIFTFPFGLVLLCCIPCTVRQRCNRCRRLNN